MPLNFPTTGLTAGVTTYTFGGNTWIWNGYAWDSVVTPASVGITGYVFSVNGLTGVVTGIAVTGNNTFTGLQTMNAGISASNLVVSGGVTFGPYSWDGNNGNLVVIDSPNIQLGDVNGVGENQKLIIDNNIGNNIRAYGDFYVYNNLYCNWIRPSSGSSIKIGNSTSSMAIGDDGEGNNTKIVLYDPTQLLNIVNANGIINIGDAYETGNLTKLVVDDTTNTVTVNGNLIVSGGITSTFSENVLIEDNFILLNSNVTGGSPSENAGIEISRGASANVQLRWNETTDKWQFTNDGTQFYDMPTSVVSSWNGSTGAVTFSNYVTSVNGSTGAVTNVARTNTAQTFTALQDFSSGISAGSGVTFSSAYAGSFRTTTLRSDGTALQYIGDYSGVLGSGYFSVDNSSGSAVNKISGRLYTDDIKAGAAISVTGAISASTTITSTGRMSNAGMTATGAVAFTSSVTANNLWVSQGATFAARSYFTSGLTADNLWVTNGATFGARSSFNNGVTASNLYVTNGATFANTVVSDTGYRVSSSAFNAQSGTAYTVSANDNGEIITMSNGATSTVTIPAGLAVGFNTMVIQLGTGQVGFTAASGVTLNSYASAFKISGQHGAATLISYATNVYNISGTLSV